MRRRQLKKLVKANVRKRGPWAQAHSRGSKKLVRRWKTMCRYWSNGGARFEQHRIMDLKVRAVETKLTRLRAGDAAPEELWGEMLSIIREWSAGIEDVSRAMTPTA